MTSAPGALDPGAALALADREFGDRLALVAAEDWDRPSNCEGWSIGDLADHVIGGNAFTIAVLLGADVPAALGRARDQAFAGVDDRTNAYRVSAEEMLGHALRPDVPASTYPHVTGAVSGLQLVELRVEDVALHAWDLARSIGADERLDPRLVAFIWHTLMPRRDELADDVRFGGGSDGSVPDDAPLQTRLLDLVGRRT